MDELHQRVNEILQRNNYQFVVSRLANGYQLSLATKRIICEYKDNTITCTYLLQDGEESVKDVYSCPKYAQRLFLAQYLALQSYLTGFHPNFIIFTIDNELYDFNEFFGYCTPEDFGDNEIEKEITLSHALEIHETDIDKYPEIREGLIAILKLTNSI